MSRAGGTHARILSLLGMSWKLVTSAANKWLNEGGPRLAAALSYYMAFSVAPLLLVVMALTGLLAPGHEQGIVDAALQLLPSGGADAVEELLAALGRERRSGTLAAIAGGATLLLGASAVFAQLQDALNEVWGQAAHPPAGLRGFIRQRLFSFALLVLTGFMLLVSLVLSTALSLIVGRLHAAWPEWAAAATILQSVTGVAMASAVFTLVFRFVPDAPVLWRDAGRGGVLAGVLFTTGQVLLGTYLANPARTSVYGSFASLVVFLLWVYYSAQLLLFGAAVTYVSGERRANRTRLAGRPARHLRRRRSTGRKNGSPRQE